MCGKCGGMMKLVACGSNGLGMLSLVLAAVTRLGHIVVMGLGPRSFAVASALLLLVSISLHTCKATCGSEEHHA